jgi:hypothetical protein
VQALVAAASQRSEPAITMTPHSRRVDEHRDEDDDTDQAPRRESALALLRPKGHLGLRLADRVDTPLPTTAQPRRPQPSSAPLLMLTDGDIASEPSASSGGYDAPLAPESDADRAAKTAVLTALGLPKYGAAYDVASDTKTASQLSLALVTPPPDEACCTDVLAIEAAAMASLRVKAEKARIEANKKAREKSDAKRAEKGVMKRPAAALHDDECKPKDPALPTEFKGGFDYNGGVIYLSKSKKCFRIIYTKGVFEGETHSKWFSESPTQAAWTIALRKIDAARKSKR